MSKGAGLTAGPYSWPATPAAGQKARAPTGALFPSYRFGHRARAARVALPYASVNSIMYSIRLGMPGVQAEPSSVCQM